MVQRREKVLSQLPPRTYGFWTCVFVVAASMVGSGILMTPGRTLAETQSPAALFIVWTLGGFLALCGALTVAQLGAALPHVGGDYVFVRRAFGDATAFVFGWSCLLFTFSGPLALIAVMAVDYIFPDNKAIQGTNATLIATGIIILFTLLHSLGQNESAWIQNMTTLVKLLIFLGFAAAGFLTQHGSYEHFASGAPIAAVGGWSLVAKHLTYAMYAYSGWNGAGYLAGEVRDPERTLPRSLIVGCVLVTALYLLMNAVYVYAISASQLAQTDELDVRRIGWLAGEILFGKQVSHVLSIIFGIGLLATISALLFTAPRIAFMMARDGLMPEPIGWLHASRNTPIPATLLVGGLSVIMLWSGKFNEVLDFTSVGLTALGGLTVASIFPLWWKREVEWPFRLPLFPLPPILFLAITIWTVVLATAEAPIPGLGSMGAIILAIPLYSIYRWTSRGRSSGSSDDQTHEPSPTQSMEE
ncbi:amino acid permease [bacterium]|nr:amino acid permease [bacterium]